MPVTPFPQSTTNFLERFPEFSKTNVSNPSLVQDMLDDAALVIDPSTWGPLAGQGHGYLAAHMLALSPFGQQARLVLDGKAGDSTTYQKHYERLMRLVGSGYRVL